MTGQGNRAAGLTFVVLATVGWSLSGLFVRLMPELNGWQINAWRGLWLGLSLLVWLIFTHRGKLLEEFDRLPFAAVVISAFCFAMSTTIYVTSLTLVNTAAVSVIGATSPLITAMLSPWLTGERPHILSWVAALVALGGMGVIAQHGFENGNLFGLILSFGVPVAFALQTLMLRRYRDHDMMTTICAGGFLSFIIASLTSLFMSHIAVFDVSRQHMLLLFAMGVVQLAVPLIFYGWGARSVPAVTLSLIVMLDAVFNPFWSWAVVGEVPEFASLVGGAIILGAVTLSIIAAQFFPARTA